MRVDLGLKPRIGRIEVVDLREGPSIGGRRLWRHTGFGLHDLLGQGLLVLDLFDDLLSWVGQVGSVGDVRLIVLGIRDRRDRVEVVLENLLKELVLTDAVHYLSHDVWTLDIVARV